MESSDENSKIIEVKLMMKVKKESISHQNIPSKIFEALIRLGNLLEKLSKNLNLIGKHNKFSPFSFLFEVQKKSKQKPIHHIHEKKII